MCIRDRINTDNDKDVLTMKTNNNNRINRAELLGKLFEIQEAQKKAPAMEGSEELDFIPKFNDGGAVSPYSDIDSISVRTNNPMNITDKGFGKVVGSEQPQDGDNPISSFNSMEEGFAAFIAKTQYALDGKSSVYKPDMSIVEYNKKFATSPVAYRNFKSIAKSMFGVDVKDTDTFKEVVDKVGGVKNFSEIMSKKENEKVYKAAKEDGLFDRVTDSNYKDILKNGYSPSTTKANIPFSDKIASKPEQGPGPYAPQIATNLDPSNAGQPVGVPPSVQPTEFTPSVQPTESMGVVDYMNSMGQDSSYTNRKKLAEQYGIEDYRGTAEQNMTLRDLLAETVYSTYDDPISAISPDGEDPLANTEYSGNDSVTPKVDTSPVATQPLQPLQPVQPLQPTQPELNIQPSQDQFSQVNTETLQPIPSNGPVAFQGTRLLYDGNGNRVSPNPNEVPVPYYEGGGDTEEELADKARLYLANDDIFNKLYDQTLSSIDRMGVENKDEFNTGKKEYSDLNNRLVASNVLNTGVNVLGNLAQSPIEDPELVDSSFANMEFKQTPNSVIDSQIQQLRAGSNSLAAGLLNSGTDPRLIPSLLAPSRDSELQAESSLRSRQLLDQTNQDRARGAALQVDRDFNNRSRVRAGNDQRTNRNQIKNNLTNSISSGIVSNSSLDSANVANQRGNRSQFNNAMNTLEEARRQANARNANFSAMDQYLRESLLAKTSPNDTSNTDTSNTPYASGMGDPTLINGSIINDIRKNANRPLTPGQQPNEWLDRNRLTTEDLTKNPNSGGIQYNPNGNTGPGLKYKPLPNFKYVGQDTLDFLDRLFDYNL